MREGVRGSKKQVWLISKSNLSWSYYFLRNCKIFVYDKNMGRQSLGVLLSPIQNIGANWPKSAFLNQYFQKYLFLSVQTCLKDRFCQVLHASVSFMSRYVLILKMSAKNGQKCPFFTKTSFSQNHAGTDFWYRNDARKLRFGLEVPLDSI